MVPNSSPTCPNKTQLIQYIAGPIIRISPWEIHVNDPDWNEPYKVTSKVNKYDWFYRFVNTPDSAFGSSDYELHRIRRKAQHNFFTQESVARFEPMLQRQISKFVTRLREHKSTGRPVSLSHAFRSLAADVVTDFSFYESQGLLDQPDFGATFHKSIKPFPEIGYWHRHFGLILNVIKALPRWFVKRTNPGALLIRDFMKHIDVVAEQLVANFRSGAVVKRDGRSNVIHQMLESPDLSEWDKRTARLALEVRTFVNAGTETTGNMLTSTTYYLLANPEMGKRLREEIAEAQKASFEPLSSQDLQALPYFVSCFVER